MIQNTKNQQGFVLVVALVFLIALTGVASALMLNTTSDMKMSGASQEKVIAMQEAIGSLDEVILLNAALGADNIFLGTIFPVGGTAVAVSADNTTATITIPNSNLVKIDCPAMKGGDDNDLTKCNMLKVTVVKRYGNNSSSTIVVNAGIAQQVGGN